ncbi:uncharacterized protein LOC117648296 [Thrips palmi]|uniref:Uncharacterized protein LOC117648296 n=1 Tax=Thrips palmi TaxID=161013 RepID=A0A6P8ZQY1_THRPL|nr:uncharacterized protein LOC117648296 [Thrips palmi]
MDRCRRGDHTPYRVMYHEERRKLRISRQAAARIPLVSLRSSMRRARLENRPRIPHSLKDFDKVLRSRRYRRLSRTMDGKDNVYAGRAGSAADKTISLIFVTRRMRRYMRKVKRIFCDGTFSPVPRGMKAYQVWTISTIREHHVVPLVRVLMRRRTRKAYEAALEKIQALVPQFKPQHIFADYESGEQKALANAFPDADCSGCLFHYAKSVGGKSKKLGMTKKIKDSPHVRRVVRSFCALPLLPQSYIIRGYNSLLKTATKKRVAATILPLANYWQTQWLNKVHLLSVSGCEDRTTNGSECDNRMFQDAVRQARPNCWDFMDGVLEMEDCTHQDIAVMEALRRPSRIRSTAAVSNDSKIQALTRQLEEGLISVRGFLKTASYTIVGAFNRGLNGKKKKKNV